MAFRVVLVSKQVYVVLVIAIYCSLFTATKWLDKDE